MYATPEGVEELGEDYVQLPSGKELLNHWRSHLPEGERKVFEAIILYEPNPVNREQISEETGYKRSTRDRYIQRLQARKLVETNGSGMVKTNDELFV